jgi:polar amino acid transport system substrate-binding protein
VKQVLQNARTGALELVEVPVPSVGPGQVRVRNCFSVVSPGTERQTIDFARKPLFAKARSRPDLVRQVVHKLRHDGPLPTWRAVTSRLEAPQPLGYSCAGVVEEVGAGVVGVACGDRVACAGAGYANHAEWVVVPENLVAHVPDGVELEHAAFATLGAIALQGLRIAAPTLGEVAAVIGLGLIGQLEVQLLRANGCRVIGTDLDPSRVEQARRQGAEWGALPGELDAGWSHEATEGRGVDFAVVTAASEQSAAPLALAARLCRHKGRIVVVGATPLELDRRTVYEKELELRMSTSYGPGRYDRTYEELGLDYPLAYVRWTENRNLQAFLALLASGALQLGRLDTQTLPFEEAVRAYEGLARGERSALALVFRYAEDAPRERILPLSSRAPLARDEVGVGFIGAGSYAKAVLLPGVREVPRVRRIALVTATGPSGLRSAQKFGFASCATDPETVLADPDVHLVFIATRHDLHAELAVRALRAGKSVWLEKPVGLHPEEVEEVVKAAREAPGLLAIGYNRRFSPHTRAIREHFAQRRGPLALRYTVSVGPPPRGTWVMDPHEGGGRIIGEACHFVDLCAFLVGAPPVSVFARALARDPEIDDSLVASLGFPDGSTATIEYLAGASAELPKERFEVSGEGRTASCDNFRLTRVVGARRSGLRTLNQDKGQRAALEEVITAVREGRPSPFRPEEIAAVSRATFAMLESAASGRALDLRK